ncbi:hypothetical protein, partial [Pseudomonas sp. R62]|uniref:hypothetical protein n=1 Tax=Pseudomonas sp. R62 TaxID=1144884 RepID=UPI001EE673B1
DVAGGSRSKALELALIVEWGGFAAGSCAALFFCGSELARDSYLRDTSVQRIYPDPCGSLLASDGGLPADQSLTGIPNFNCGSEPAREGVGSVNT